jgi:hypothetical protein
MLTRMLVSKGGHKDIYLQIYGFSTEEIFKGNLTPRLSNCSY